MTLRTGVYIVPTHRWYIERTVWLIAGIVLLASTLLTLLVNRLWIFGVIATGLISINVAFTGFCPVGNVLRLFGFTPMLGSKAAKRWGLYFMQTDKWYLERRIYVAVVSTSPSRRCWCWCTARGGLRSRFSSAARWCGSPRRVTA
jgi:Protein of unknown function (DUF2892)